MKKHSCYLREDQITFLRNLDNASQFIREALDLFISNSDRSTAEKTICTYEASKELEDKITAQALLIKTNGKETEEIEKEVKRAQLYHKVAQNIANGEFQVQQSKGKWRVLASTTESKYTIVTDGHDTEEQAEAKAKERGQIAIKNTKKELKELNQKKQRHNTYLQAQKAKLRNMEKNLETLKASMT